MLEEFGAIHGPLNVGRAKRSRCSRLFP
jgi:hypothetical protein